MTKDIDEHSPSKKMRSDENLENRREQENGLDSVHSEAEEDNDDVISDTEEIVQEEYVEESDSECEEEDEANEGSVKGVKLNQGELDMSVYSLFRTLKLTWPCLTLDTFPQFDPDQFKSPYALTFVAGSQADRDRENRVYIFKCISHGKKQDQGEENSDDSSSSSEEEEEEKSEEESTAVDQESELDPVAKKAKKSGGTKRKNTMHCKGVKHNGTCNRVRQSALDSSNFVVASWSNKASISLFNVNTILTSLDASKSSYETDARAASQVYNGHKVEGYALDWSTVSPNQAASADVNGNLHVWEVADKGSRIANVSQLKGCKDSIEDIQWSPAEATVLSTCGVDKTVRIWDRRTLTRSMLSVDNAHSSDVNVISWNSYGEPFIVSGSDDHKLKVWDLRKMSSSQGKCSPVAQFDFHKGPITSVQWNPQESTQFAASSSDNTVSVWDLSLERDDLSTSEGGEEDGIPAQLLFLHEGQQTDIKEITWHASVKNLIMSSAADGFHMFIPSNL